MPTVDNWYVTSRDVISRALQQNPQRKNNVSLVSLGQACALIDNMLNSATPPLDRTAGLLVFNVAIQLIELELDFDSIAVYMIHYLPDPILTDMVELNRYLPGLGDIEDSFALYKALIYFNRLEWNAWPKVAESGVESGRDKTVEALYRFALEYPNDSTEASDTSEAKLNRRKRLDDLLQLLRHVGGFLKPGDYRASAIKIMERLLLTKMVKDQSFAPAIPIVIERVSFAKINLAVYAPLADSLGMWQFKSDLEDLSFEIVDHSKYSEIHRLLDEGRTQREKMRTEIVEEIRQYLESAGLDNVEITSRTKHIYSIYQKMLKRATPFEQMNDLLGIRVIIKHAHSHIENDVEQIISKAKEDVRLAEQKLDSLMTDTRSKRNAINEARSNLAKAKQHASIVKSIKTGSESPQEQEDIDQCYTVLSLLIARWPPMYEFYEGQAMRNWIETPKSNGYQSIHTTLLINDSAVEVQIRTERMHKDAEMGVAAHWKYKQI